MPPFVQFGGDWFRVDQIQAVRWSRSGLWIDVKVMLTGRKGATTVWTGVSRREAEQETERIIHKILEAQARMGMPR